MGGQGFGVGGRSQTLISWSYVSHIFILTSAFRIQDRRGWVEGYQNVTMKPQTAKMACFFIWWLMLINSFLFKCSQIFTSNSFKKKKKTHWTPNGPCAFNHAFSNLLQNFAPVGLNFLDLWLEESILFLCLRFRLTLAWLQTSNSSGGREGPQLQKVAITEITRSGQLADNQSDEKVCCVRALLPSVVHWSNAHSTS